MSDRDSPGLCDNICLDHLMAWKTFISVAVTKHSTEYPSRSISSSSSSILLLKTDRLLEIERKWGTDYHFITAYFTYSHTYISTVKVYDIVCQQKD